MAYINRDEWIATLQHALLEIETAKKHASEVMESVNRVGQRIADVSNELMKVGVQAKAPRSAPGPIKYIRWEKPKSDSDDDDFL
jgi:hypothetical protein